MRQNLISVIVPIYNMERYLEQCIQSLLNQDYKNIEILLINDGSNDNSAAICRKYSKKDRRIIYIEQENQGVSAARNTGICHSSGEWISFVDGDDWATLDMLSSLLRCAEDKDVIIGDAYAAKNGKIDKFSFFTIDIAESQKRSPLYLIGNALGCTSYGAGKYSNVGVPWAKLYRREFLVRNHIEFPVGVRRMQDMLFNINIFSKTQRVNFCNRPIYYYRITDNSVCRRYDSQYDEVIQQILLGLRDLVESNKDPEIQKLYDFKRVQLLLENIALHYGHPKCPLAYKEKRKGIKQIFDLSVNRNALETCEKSLFSRKQKIILGLLLNHRYAVVYQIYHLRNMVQKFLKNVDM
ncbi:glycosyltransferase [Zhenpiania hominis]|uniref:Glycosyltransferase n=1 Tax=Zhenpiania hominis TaxID=2763644 RepID=A0A923NJF0_9FIRM|nr:glycosyltransferase [Zhenpiania hominis]MBC6679569.1 glycosyltransferase [Zhenpiania hominis]